MPVLVVIPARLGSTRLPRKPLQPLGGVPLIVRVAERIQEYGIADRLVVATDAEAVAAVVRAAGFDVRLTATHHQSGTDRVQELCSSAEFAGFDEIVSVQGDAPFVPEQAAIGALVQLRKGFDLGTAAVALDPEAAGDPARVKVVITAEGRALYFSRAPIPFQSHGERRPYWRHLGVYAYTRSSLGRMAQSPASLLELTEGLEQLRALELGLSIGVERLLEPAPPDIDTWDDLREAEAYWTVTQGVTR